MKKRVKNVLKRLAFIMIALPLVFGAFMSHADSSKKATLYHPLTQDRKEVTVGDRSAFAGGYLLETPKRGFLGAAAASAQLPLVLASFETSLQSKISATDTTMTLVSGTDAAGNALSGYYGFTIDSGSASQEYVIANCTSTSCSSMTRGISVKDGQTSVAALKFSHRRGASVKITDHPALTIINQILNGNDGVPDTLYYDTHPTFTSNTQIIDKKYADDLSYVGAPDASSTVKGVSEEATQAEIDAGTATGGTSARLYVNPALLGTSIYATRLPSSTQKDALVGTSGTPGTSNKYVTNDDTDTAATASKVPRRSASGQITVPTTPVATTDAASKAYVDSGDSAFSSNFVGVGASGAKTYFTKFIPFMINTGGGLSAAIWTLTTSTLAYNYNYGVISGSGGAGSIRADISDEIGTVIDFTSTKKVITEVNLKVNGTGTNSIVFGLGTVSSFSGVYNAADEDVAAFSIDNSGNLYAHTSNGTGTTNHTETQITGITLTNKNRYRIEHNPGVSALFYVNGVLKATITTTLPNNDAMYLGFGQSGATNYITSISAPTISVEI